MPLGGGSMKNICKIVITAAQIGVCLWLLSSCAAESAATSELDSSPGTFADAVTTEKTLSPTIYYIKLMNVHEQKCESKRTIFDVNGKPLTQVCPSLYKMCVIEGTCALLESDDYNVETEWENSSASHDINLINYVKMKNGVPLFQKVDTSRCPFGYGVKGMCLDPFYNLAADLNYHKPGDVIFVPKVVGTVLPSGERHNGYFVVRDKGGAIKGADRFDFFTGFLDYRNSENPFTKLGLNDKNIKFEFKKIMGVEAENIRKRRNYPLTPLSHKASL